MGEKKRRAPTSTSLTLNDVAQKAGVSATTVSFVLNENGLRNKHVSEETRTKVLLAVQELNYHPNTLARTLGKGQSRELIRIVDITNTLFGVEMDNSFQQQALLYGYTPVMYVSRGLSVEQRKALYRSIFDRRPLAIFASPFSFTAKDVIQAKKTGIEQIIFFSFTSEPIEQAHTIVFPSFSLGFMAAQHLLERGHRRLALVRPDDPIHATQELAFLQRLEGMRVAIAQWQDVTLDILPLSLSTAVAHEMIESRFVGSGYATGIYAYNDEYALLLLGALMCRGIRVPQEIGIVGTDNISVAEYCCPPLTSISFDTLDIGKRAVELFHTLHQGLLLPEELTLPLVPRLIVRGSV